MRIRYLILFRSISLSGQRAMKGTEGHPGLAAVVASSLADEYVPHTVDRVRLAQRISCAMRGLGLESDHVVNLTIKDANHNLSRPPDAITQFVTAVGNMLATIVV